MAICAAERGKLPATRDGLAKNSSAVRAAAVSARAIPLGLAPFLQPYRKEGRLSLRVERMQQLARLSRGRNNGDGSWSLATDELDDLEYLCPEGMGEAQSLSVRIIGLDQGGTTLAIVEVPISASAKPASTTQNSNAANAISREQDALIQLQRDELKSLNASLAEREMEIAQLRQAVERPDKEPARDTLASELAAARESWKRELEQLLADAGTQATAALEQAQAKWKAERAVLIAKTDKQAGERLVQAQDRSSKEQKDALAQAEAGWKAAETKRLTDAEAGWRAKSASALAEAVARCERAEKALSEARTKGPAKPARDDTEVRTLREELATLRAVVAERDASLVQAQRAVRQEQEDLRRAHEAALSSAKSAWKDAEAARATAAETLWRKQSAAALEDLSARCGRAEAALVDARKQGDAAAKSARDDTERRLQKDLAALRTTLVDRDAALAQAHLGEEQSLQDVRRESEAELSKAQTRWKNEEAARFAVVEAQWRGQSERVLAEVAARCAHAETALSDAQAHAEETATESQDEASRVRAELVSIQAVLADRDMALAQTRLTAERALQRVQQEADSALTKAQAGWKAEETTRLAAAEAQWRRQSAGALAEATARYKEAETALAQIRTRGGSLDKGESEIVTRLRNEIALLEFGACRSRQRASSRAVGTRAARDVISPHRHSREP